MLSVSNLLNCEARQQQQQQQIQNQHQHQQPRRRPAVLDISNLLCSYDSPKSPSLSPSLTPSPASVTSSYTSYPFPLNNGRNTPPPTSVWNSHKPIQEPVIWNHHHHPHHHSHQKMLLDNSRASTPMSEEDEDDDDDDTDELDEHGNLPLKAKRRRANSKQLEVLNRVFERTFFPSTQMRVELGRQLGMSPRTVQIWFQNRRQAIRTRERQRLLRIHKTSSSD
ncbi:Homeodomain-like DNA binding domain-containing transcription factor [Phycomyces blakesleeanus]|uniref:Homeodomain-like DNA binding domain-containing transcription factor n=2 Tax=Phycomyces blakesleeanus TaxID=4837 RepID=A0A167PUH4_PHYB8|nr:Homeodomain-like DNA binding domain-containing transcription factor [Phycomyces blakesleeanus NRRL 1555(-)]OAD78558.1 Homeodomain-like DNA binding domain-containing transcription factor [Phycomyces blakesleeanus NRRL 1555(-)]|eukprot:XP_018296598.1 Homeodomain-like DNA binding domain-containing transcription factor [Phycomyces blakesleeanus NRRL 1555(-)]